MTSGYELLDAGDGRRLERFGDFVVDRPAPGADDPLRAPDAWDGADLRYERDAGWLARAGQEVPGAWEMVEGDLRLELRPTATGQVGLFPEQGSNRAWVRDLIGQLTVTGGEPAVLNLFAYTGAMTLSAVAAGAAVTHVDGSRPTVAWARRNADLSALADRPVRWIVDDAEAFVAREQRRGRPYDGFVLDPPSYGHGAGGRTWRLSERLPGLLDACVVLTGPRPAFAVLSAHSHGFGPDRLADQLASALRRRPADVDAGELALRAQSGARLRLGAYARIIGR
ncbi:MAG TPA: class I SAM-dependent methyltransferase [Candidatus Limnocylindrales bacterium]|nr:class I SAM-dependent methyltransferase [Candidatus Limnocylindrales bacterium]